MINYGISKLFRVGIYNLMEDYNFIRILGLIRRPMSPQVYKGPFFRKVSILYNDISAIDLNGIRLKRSPGLCKQWISEQYK